MDVNAVDYDIGDELDGDTRSVSDVDVGAAAVNGLEAVHDELLLQGNDHVPLENNPEGLVLDDGMAERPRAGVHGVVIIRVGDDVVPAVTAANGIAAEPDATVRQPLAVVVPIRVAPPAIVDGIAGAAREVAKLLALGAVAYTPV